MKDNWERLQPQKIVKTQVDKRVNQLSKIIQNPDKWNANIASKERVDKLDEEVTELKQMVEKLNARIDGLNYLVKQLIK